MLKPTLVLAAILSAGLAIASVHAPRVISPHRADAYSMETFRDFHRWRDLSGDALAYEVYKYLVDYESGVFHMNEVLEGEDVISEYITVRDPVKIINVYGYGYCGIFGPTMAGVMDGMGVGPTRTLVIPDWNHVASEAYYDNAWHYLDLDVRAVFRRADGTLASMAEAKTDETLWQGERNELFFPNDPLGKVQETYKQTEVMHFNSHHQSGHTLDFVLRQGETFTRWWHPQGGRWNHAERYNESEWLTKLIEGPPRGPKPNHRHFTIHNHANGQFVYAPDLTDQSTDFADGVYDSENVTPSADGLTATGAGYAIFEVRSPYIIVPKVGDSTTTDDDREASVVALDSDGTTLSVSLDNGLTWTDVAEDPDTADLTASVGGKYGYLLRLEMEDGATVRSLRIETWVQVAPAALPALEQGANRMELRSGDHHGMDSRVVEVSASAGNPEELLKYCVEPPEDLDTERKTARLVGPVTIRVDAPPNAKIAWLSIGAGFRTHQLDAAAQTKNEIGYAVGEPVNFTAIYTSDVPTDQQHWHYNVDEEVVLDEPAETVYCRYVGDPALNQVRIYAHCIDDEPREPSPMVVTHTWTEDGERKRHVADLGGAADYEVQVDGEPVNESVRMQVLSDGPNAAIETDDAQAGVDTTDATDWVEAMKLVHARHAGEKGVFACFGDSITDSRAFWFSLKHARKDAPPEMVAAFQTVSGHMLDDCWDRKGAQFGNQGSMAIEWAYQNIDGWLRNLNPEAAIFMFGTNDLNNINAAKYEERLREIMQRCLDNGTVVILSTIPPRNTFEEKSAEFADVARAVADDMNLPLVDFHAEIMRRRPDDWNGALDKFAAYEGYDVPTLIARDGVHPSNPKQYSATYSDEALNNCGFALRNQMVLMKYAEVIGEVLGG